MGRVVSLPISEFVNTCVASRPTRVPMGQSAEQFWYESLFKKESLCLPSRGQVTFLAQSNELRKGALIIGLLGSATNQTFSASLAASLAFGRVVFICSCSMRDVTMFLFKIRRQDEK